MSRRNPRDRRVKMLRLWLRGLRKDARREADAGAADAADAGGGSATDGAARIHDSLG